MASQLIQAGSRITASLLQSIAPLAVIKGADESVVSSTVLQNDNQLFVPVVANATYVVACYLDYEAASGAGNGITWTWTGPSGYTMRYQGTYFNTAATPAVILSTHQGSDTPAAGGNGAGSLAGIDMNGSLFVGAAGGTLQLEWAQATSSATATIVHAQSYLALWRIS